MNTKYIDKINSLLSKTIGNGATEAEAMEALLLAQKLMAKHGINQADLIGFSDKLEYLVSLCEHKGNKGFRPNLANIIAKNFRCHPFMRGNTVCMFGRKEDSLAAKSAFNFSYAIAKKLGDAEVARCRKEGLNTKEVFNSYVKGFLRGMATKFDEQCTALMIVVPEDVKSEYKLQVKLAGEYTGGMRQQSLSTEVYLKGLKDGKSALDIRSLEA